MKHIIAGLLLFILQIYLTVLGVNEFGKYLNPVLLFIVSASIPVYLINQQLSPPSEYLSQKKPQLPWIKIIWTVAGLLIVLVAYEELRKVFVRFSEVEKWSDVIPQVKTLYERFIHGELPYAPIPQTGYDLLPVYMPFHWLPAGLGNLFHVDIRFIGFGLFAFAVSVYGWFMASQKGSYLTRILALILPSLPLWAFVIWQPADLSVTYEIVIGAYYLVLAVGLLTRKLCLVTAGIILCLLSRYTLIFWLPLFAVLLFYEKGIKKSLLVWGTVAVCIIAFFIIPFYSKDPGLLKRGLSYYMGATVADWHGYGDPPVSWTQEQGVFFAPLMKATFKGEMANRVYWARVIQSIALLITLIGGLWAYSRWRDRIDMFLLCLVWLYGFMMVYYFFAPLTYRYYLFSFLVVSAVLCGMIVLHPIQNKHRNIV